MEPQVCVPLFATLAKFSRLEDAPMVSLNTINLVALSALLTCSSLAAEESDGDTRPSDSQLELLDEITVTGSRETRSAFDEPASVTVIQKSDLERQNALGNFVDAFAEVQGVSVQKTAQGQGSPFIRGFTGFLNLLLIDGVRFNNSIVRSGPNQYWATIDPLSADAIDVVRGPGSTLYGSDAAGGTVNVLTRGTALAGAAAINGALTYRGAEAENSSIGHTELGGRTERIGWRIGASHKDFGDFEAGGDTGRVENSSYDEAGADAKLSIDLGTSDRLTFVGQRFEQNDVPRTETTIFSKSFEGTSVGTELQRDHDQGRSLAYARYSRLRDRGALQEAMFTLSYQDTEEERDRIRGNGRIDLSGFDVNTWGAQAQLRSESSWGRFTYGFDAYRDSVDSFRRDFNADGSLRGVSIQGAVADDAEYETLGVFVQNQFSLFQDALSLIVGARWNRHALDARAVEDPVTGKQIGIEDDWSAVVGSLRALWRVDRKGASHWHVFGSLAEAFRAPNLSDVTSFDATSAIETPTLDLEPENYLTLELGAKRRTGKSSISASAFRTRIDDQIVQSPTGRFVDGTPEVQKSNVGDGYVQGVEFAGRGFVTSRYEVLVNGSWTEGRVDQIRFLSNGSAEEIRAPVSRLVPLVANLGVRYHASTGRYWLGTHVTAFSKADKLALRDVTDRRRIPPGGTPGFVVLDLRGAVTLFDGRARLSFALENVFDEDYRIHGSGQNMVGRNLVFGLGWDF